MKYLHDKMCMEFCNAMMENIKFDPLFKNLIFYHIPNGGYRKKREGGRFKAMGVLPGVCDYQIVRAIMPYHGLYIEFKTEKDDLTPVQKNFISQVQKEGYKVEVVWSVREAIQVVVKYLKMENKKC